MHTALQVCFRILALASVCDSAVGLAAMLGLLADKDTRLCFVLDADADAWVAATTAADH